MQDRARNEVGLQLMRARFHETRQSGKRIGNGARPYRRTPCSLNLSDCIVAQTHQLAIVRRRSFAAVRLRQRVQGLDIPLRSNKVTYAARIVGSRGGSAWSRAPQDATEDLTNAHHFRAHDRRLFACDPACSSPSTSISSDSPSSRPISEIIVPVMLVRMTGGDDEARTFAGRRWNFRRLELVRKRRNEGYPKRMERIGSLYERLSFPVAVFMLFSNRRFHPRYGMTWRKKMALGLRIYRNCRHVRTGIGYKAHLAMAAKLLTLPPTVKGAVVECGSWLGGTTTNLSIICDIVGRDLIVYDSFEGLPAPEAADNMKPAVKGSFVGSLETVQGNVRKYGVIDRCQFRKGWFKDTLTSHSEPIAFCFIDVDLKSSIHTCVVNLWPHLVQEGYLFFDEYIHLHNCALFFSERFWHDYLDTKPPGLMGTGTGVGVGQYFLGPWNSESPRIQRPSSVAYTRKDFNGLWDYVPESRR
jgi:O-methyltransferase